MSPYDYEDEDDAIFADIEWTPIEVEETWVAPIEGTPLTPWRLQAVNDIFWSIVEEQLPVAWEMAVEDRWSFIKELRKPVE